MLLFFFFSSFHPTSSTLLFTSILTFFFLFQRRKRVWMLFFFISSGWSWRKRLGNSLVRCRFFFQWSMILNVFFKSFFHLDIIFIEDFILASKFLERRFTEPKFINVSSTQQEGDWKAKLFLLMGRMEGCVYQALKRDHCWTCRLNIIDRSPFV